MISRRYFHPLTRRDSGFTLVELAVYIVVLGIISIVIATTVTGLFRSEETVSGLTNAASEGQNAATLLRSDLRFAREIRVSSDGNTVTASIPDAKDNTAWDCVRWSTELQNPQRDGSNGHPLMELTREIRDEAPGNWGVNPRVLIGGLLQPDADQPALVFADPEPTTPVAKAVEYTWRVQTAGRSWETVHGVISRDTRVEDVTSSMCFG